MPSTFPPTVDNFGADVVDGVDDVMAAHVNDLRNAIVAAQTYLLEVAGDLADDVAARIGENLLPCSLTHEESWQGGTTLNDIADDTYGPTLWNVLNSGDAPDVAGVGPAAGLPNSRYFRLTFDANTQRAGIVQFLTAQQTRALRGKAVSLSADLLGNGVSNLRMAIATWTGTADTVPSDIVSAWGATPTLATSWAFIGTPASIAVTTGFDRYAVENLTIPTSANNLAIFIWTPDQEDTGDLFAVAQVKLEVGETATEFVARDPGDELRLIQRFYEKSFPITTAPANGVTSFNIMGAAPTTGLLQCNIFFKTRKRTNPTITLYRGDQGATNGTWSQFVGGVWDDPTSSAIGSFDTTGFHINNTDAGVFTVGNAHLMRGNWVADARL